VTTYRSYAKLNLHLQVCGRRPDGYHELRTIFQTIDLHDEIELQVLPKEAADEAPAVVNFELLSGNAPPGSDNLIVRAVRAYAERWPIGTVNIGLHKTLRLGGGLGGASSNAATTLLALRHQTGQPSGLAELWPVARSLGADVPFFLVGGTALGVGRGDEILPLRDIAETPLWLATPAVEVSTPEIFQNFVVDPDRVALSPLIAQALLSQGEPRWETLLGQNDLQQPVLDRFPEIRRNYDILLEHWGAGVRLSGTGASLFCRAHSGTNSRMKPSGTGRVSVQSCRTVTRATIARMFTTEGLG